MLDTNTVLVIVILLALSAGVYFFIQRSNQEIPSTEGSKDLSNVIKAIRQINSRLELLEKKYSLDKEQTERSRKNIYDTLGMQIEARKLDNIVILDLLDRKGQVA